MGRTSETPSIYFVGATNVIIVVVYMIWEKLLMFISLVSISIGSLARVVALFRITLCGLIGWGFFFLIKMRRCF
jgi:phage-related minor tail protein